jgi:spermidine synthase
MNRWELVESVTLPDGTGVMDLLRRGKELAINVDGQQLMSTRMHGSEDALAELTCRIISDRPNARVLIGGLGMGYTLAAALRCLGPEAAVVVAELVPAVVRWNQGVLGSAAAQPLLDPRASVYPNDVADQMDNPAQPWDAILLDVDNGPDALTHAGNGWLGLGAAYSALTPGGALGVWSAWPDKSFTHRLSRVGFRVTEHKVRARGSKGGRRHMVWVAVRD